MLLALDCISIARFRGHCTTMEHTAVSFREDIVPYRQSRNSLARGVAALTMTPWHSGRWVLPRLRPTFLKLGLC